MSKKVDLNANIQGESSLKVTFEVVSKFKNNIEKLKQNSDNRVLKNDEIIENLKKAYRKKDLVIVLGAGISKELGMPGWNTLLEYLLVKLLCEDSDNKEGEILSKSFFKYFDMNPLIIGRILEDYFSKENKDFSKIIKKILYENLDDKKTVDTMNTIADLCSGNNKLDSIITYNYDDNLEKVFEKNNIDFKSIYNKDQKLNNDRLPIYHVHGYLPNIDKKERNIDHSEEKLVFGETTYHNQYSNVYNWNNITQINKFKNKTCLFIGLSLTDPNLRRLLDISNYQKGENKFHYVISKQTKIDNHKEKLELFLKRNDDIYDEKIDANINRGDLFENLITIKNIMDIMNYTSLGLQPYWIEDFNKDIPELLKQIK